ncbi:MAG: hypothetical protein BGO51_19135 [Rhodospirillales bacterium 69-11]|nr:GGDEF domain-containing protein [Rhodospirillales bacterium]OJW28596.1 MAG: hypothetical protein BGO51_19135 [Rhodospirillales bacterium 69-11]
MPDLVRLPPNLAARPLGGRGTGRDGVPGPQPDDTAPGAAPGTPAGAPRDALQAALIDSRARWRDLVTMTADLAFETDAAGRFTFIVPDPALLWPVTDLLGQPARMLLPPGFEGACPNPFQVTEPVRLSRVWLRRGDGSLSCFVFSAAPLRDVAGDVIGTRGLAIEMAGYDEEAAQTAAALRRGEVLDHILWRVGQEVLAPRMMRAALEGLNSALGADGSSVVLLSNPSHGAVLAHTAGSGGEETLAIGAALLEAPPAAGCTRVPVDGRPLLTAPCETRFGDRAGLVLWRARGGRAWTEEEAQIVGAAAGLVRMVLEHETIQREMALQARTDPLTGLLNRRAFLEELERRVDRLDREMLPGTLMFADLDNLKPINDRLGHEMGDQVLIHAALLLRRVVRPADLVARLGGDEFALWMDGADHLTAAERAEQLRDIAPLELAEIAGPDAPRLSMSIGIASRRPGSPETLDALLRRADLAMYDVKRNGREHWRVALEE